MSKLMEEAIDQLRNVPPEMQDEIARAMMQLTGWDQSVYELTPEEDAELAQSDAAAARGEFAADEQMRAIGAKHGCEAAALHAAGVVAKSSAYSIISTNGIRKAVVTSKFAFGQIRAS